jgi:hypothetical protein
MKKYLLPLAIFAALAVHGKKPYKCESSPNTEWGVENTTSLTLKLGDIELKPNEMLCGDETALLTIKGQPEIDSGKKVKDGYCVFNKPNRLDKSTNIKHIKLALVERFGDKNENENENEFKWYCTTDGYYGSFD